MTPTKRRRERARRRERRAYARATRIGSTDPRSGCAIENERFHRHWWNEKRVRELNP